MHSEPLKHGMCKGGRNEKPTSPRPPAPQAQKQQNEKWMVYDDNSGDMIYHDTFASAEKDYNDALHNIDEGERVVMFKVVKEEVKYE
ncbi:hypothetical protein Kirov_114 [Bacillus phage Kirov]|uniref:Uncharacterized protein n=1 Tax=Bacillus phage Kirov TaxID=2783539 RepID=A0A7U3NKJ1_9CAUD|nr:hypothetical protein PQE67_gp190 [Bacillus phage Kirov]QOV08313.1 hypothetical protein Kirov_114 [Bacillus phage Kirov]